MLVGERRGTDLETGQGELINIGCQVARRPIDSERLGCERTGRASVQAANGRHIVQAIVDVVYAEAEIVDHGIGEKVGFIQREQAIVNREIQWEVQIARADAAAERAAQGCLQPTRTEW